MHNPEPVSLDHLAVSYKLTPEEVAALRAFDDSLVEVAAHTNLIARGSLPERWARHYEDSLQLWSLVPAEARSLLDVGSGAGFPGMILAILAHFRRPELHLTLVDSVGKKARFLSEVGASLGLSNLSVSAQRAEVFHVKQAKFDVITARAVTALPKLLDLTAPLLTPGGMLIFPKGEKADEELTAAAARWRFNCETRPSATHPTAKILLISEPKAH